MADPGNGGWLPWAAAPVVQAPLLQGEEAKMRGTHGIAIWDSVVAGQVVY